MSEPKEICTAEEGANVMARQREAKAAARKLIIREAMIELAARVLKDTDLRPDARLRFTETLKRHQEAVITDIGWRDVT